MNLYQDEDLDPLRAAYRQRRLTLFLGAGVSIGSGLPSWHDLILSMYYTSAAQRFRSGQSDIRWRPYSNYLRAITNWVLARRQEPLEVTARKLRMMFAAAPGGYKEFLTAIREALYGVDGPGPHHFDHELIFQNQTLLAVGKLCQARQVGQYGVDAVVNYNFDDLLQRTLSKRLVDGATGGRRNKTITHPTQKAGAGSLPIYHVHGFIPFPDASSNMSKGVIFTEDEFNRAAIDPYDWSNLVQLKELSGSVGLMIGLSLTDRNVRRLLDALIDSPIRPRLYAILPQPKSLQPGAEDIEAIDAEARNLIDGYEESGVKSRAFVETDSRIRGMGLKGRQVYQREIGGILDAVERFERQILTEAYEAIGVTPIWYDPDVPPHHGAVAEILDKLLPEPG